MIIGLDVGGTHTDVVLIGRKGILRQSKVPTNPTDLLESVWTGLERVTQGIDADFIRRIVLSTTLTTNAIASGNLAPVGVIVSSGPGIDPEFYRTGHHYYPVSGSIDHRGREIQPIVPAEIRDVAARLHAEGIRQVAVVGKFSTRNPQHEILIREMLGTQFECVFVGHRVSGNLNFPRRIATAYLNAAVYPIHRRFFEAVKSSLEQKNLSDVPIYILKADGGTMSLAASLQQPAQSTQSGPAASVMGSLPFASDQIETLVLDIGGTTTDMAVLVNKAPLLDPLGIELAGFKTLIRSLHTRSIGLGGDSEVRVVDGQLKVGPRRLGRAMAYGGPAPTPTDALIVLAEATEGDAEAARAGLQQVADQLGISLQEAARCVFDEACQDILTAAREMIGEINRRPVYTVHELLEGYQVNPREMLVLGGPAPQFAKRLDDLSEFTARVVPEWQVANAVGAALARTTCEITLFVDTERGIATAPEEEFMREVDTRFNKAQATELAFELLRDKAITEGAENTDTDMELLEELEFNMVRGFFTAGRNIRIKAQVKPGLIEDYRLVSDDANESG